MTFTFRPGLSVATVAALLVLISLGVWQLQRLEWKNALVAAVEQRIDAEPKPLAEILSAHDPNSGRDASYTPVLIEGVFRHDLESHVFGTFNGRPGYYVFTPLAPSPGGTPADAFVYVNRGFVPQAMKSPAVRPDGAISGVQTITGLFRTPEADRGLAAVFRPTDDLAGNIWHQRNPAAFAAASGIAAIDVYIDSSGAENGALWPQGGVTRVTFANRHFEYALTWFGLAAALLGVYISFSIRKE